MDEPLAETRSGTTSYYEADGLGSITSLSNSSGALANTYTYDSFGNLTASSGAIINPYRYTGREYDSETAAYFYRARYYDLTLGRFDSEDPGGFNMAVNFYRYGGNNAVNQRDPSGLWDTETHHALIWDALKSCGVSNDDIYRMQQASDGVDDLAGQLPWNSYQHSMKSWLQSSNDAMAERNEFISGNLVVAMAEYDQGGDWTTPYGQAIHTLMDMTSPAHMDANGDPLAWPTPWNFAEHGFPHWLHDPLEIENWAHMTPAIMQSNINMIRGALQYVTGRKCGCQE